MIQPSITIGIININNASHKYLFNVSFSICRLYKLIGGETRSFTSNQKLKLVVREALHGGYITELIALATTTFTTCPSIGLDRGDPPSALSVFSFPVTEECLFR